MHVCLHAQTKTSLTLWKQCLTADSSVGHFTALGFKDSRLESLLSENQRARRGKHIYQSNNMKWSTTILFCNVNILPKLSWKTLSKYIIRLIWAGSRHGQTWQADSPVSSKSKWECTTFVTPLFFSDCYNRPRSPLLYQTVYTCTYGARSQQ